MCLACQNKSGFSGPVASYAGIGRFVMGLMDEVVIVSPEEFKKYMRGKMKRNAEFDL